jgi:CubicO group peptidase (beta-lactamase class C family)
MTQAAHELRSFEYAEKANQLILEATKDCSLAVGVSCIAVKAGEILFQSCAGLKDAHDSSPIDERTVFDVGSLTGSLVTTNLIMQLVDEGRIKLNDRVSKYLQNFGVLGKAQITVAQLLTHTSGLPHHYSFQKDLPDLSSRALVGAKTTRGSKDALINAVNRMHLRAEPGVKHQWSEIGLLVLGLLVESITGLELDDLAEKRIFKPLKLKSTSFLNSDKFSKQKLSIDREMFAASGRCPFRGKEVRAEPFDLVAMALGGVSGYAGLFTSIVDLAVLGNEVLNSLFFDDRLINSRLAEYFCYAESDDRIAYNYGWQDLASIPELQKAKFSKRAFGRCSSLGSALLIDPEQRLVIAIAANRKNISDNQKRFDQFRAELASILVQAGH